MFAVNFLAARYIARQRARLPLRPLDAPDGQLPEKMAAESVDSHASALTAHETKVALIEVELLEAGIIFHSISERPRS